MLVKFALQGGNQLAGLLVDGTLAFKMIVMFSDGEHAFARNIFSPKHILEKRNDIFSRFGTTERDNQESVVI